MSRRRFEILMQISWKISTFLLRTTLSPYSIVVPTEQKWRHKFRNFHLDTQQLPFLIHLLDDASIRADVLKQLASFGNAVESEIERQNIKLTAEQSRIIRSLLDAHYRTWIATNWNSWTAIDDDKSKLEHAQQLIADFQYGRLYPKTLRRALDELADEFDERYTIRDPLDLAEFLFKGYGLRGAEQEDYYNPLNSNLLYVIEQRKGIPISLACIYMLVGNRVGLRIEGCNFPGHFLTVASSRRQKILVDCFNGGMVIDAESLRSVGATISFNDVLQLQCDARAITARVLRNLGNAYEQAGERENAATIFELLIRTEQ